MFADQEAQILARLQAQLPGVTVFGSFGQIDFRDVAAPDLAVQLAYRGFSVVAQQASRAKLQITWEAAVLVRHAAIDAALAAQADAALAAVIAALTGWEQAAGVLAMRINGGSEPEQDETGAWRYPINFDGPAIVAGA